MIARHRPVASAAAAVGLAITLATGAKAGSLIAHWKLDEATATAVVDSAGSYDGTNVGGATVNQPGKIGTAYSLDGVDDYVDSGVSLLNARPAFSTAGWIKPSLPPSKGG